MPRRAAGASLSVLRRGRIEEIVAAPSVAPSRATPDLYQGFLGAPVAKSRLAASLSALRRLQPRRAAEAGGVAGGRAGASRLRFSTSKRSPGFGRAEGRGERSCRSIGAGR